MRALIISILFCFIFGILGKPMDHDVSTEIVEEDTGDAKRIHGGSLATPKLFPYIVSIQFKKKKFVKFCGGSIVSDTWVLTAAHCCQHIKDENGDDKTYIRAGVTEAFATTPGFQLRKVDKYFIHEAYRSDTLQHDICLMKLKEPIQYSEYVQKIEMGPKCKSRDNRGYVIGFGRLDKEQVTEKLHYAEVGLMDIDTCSDYYPHVLKAYHICPSEEGKSSCKGDSGGPFAQTDVNGQPCLIGLSSFARKKCEEAKMAAYIKVEAYIDWIDETMAENS